MHFVSMDSSITVLQTFLHYRIKSPNVSTALNVSMSQYLEK